LKRDEVPTVGDYEGVDLLAQWRRRVKAGAGPGLTGEEGQSDSDLMSHKEWVGLALVKSAGC
jgi:hypothetical protein